jgi:dUTP pyrophosphatase
MNPQVTIERLASGVDNPTPAYQTEGSAGMDLYAALDSVDRSVTIYPREICVVPAGIKLAMPRELEAQVRPRSGLAAKHGITVLNTPGTIDSDYRGEVKVILVNHGSQIVRIHHGERIAQLVFAAVLRPVLTEGNIVADTDRGSGGFGSTGI